MASLLDQVKIEQSLVQQQQYEVHTEVRTAIDALDYEYNNTTTMPERSRRASPQPDYSYLSVDADSDLAKTKKSSLPSARLAWLKCHTRVHTEQQLCHRAGLGCLVEKNTT